ncbi:MAG: hypothetical protein JRJ10_05675 [Deltaproteobacteria bacterium]|jgi:hypothetical protein|nr:hypothetical protein [Deltaproteobacteria bacterium]MBW2405239.1 hypothetical protein [Deltaproteobacteria bacterium]
MEIFLNKRAMLRLRLSVADAVDDGEIDALREDLVSVFSDDVVEEIERRIDSGDFYDFISEILDEWSGEDLDELMELLETQLTDANVDLKYTALEKDDSADSNDSNDSNDDGEDEEDEEELVTEDDDDD